MGLGGLHKLLAHDPALGLAVLRGLKEWEHGRQCAELWGPSRPYKPISWAHLGEVGWLECEDAALWRGMGGEEGREVKEEREGASITTTTTTPVQAQAPPPPQIKTRAKPPPKAESGSSRTRTPSPTTPPLPLRRPLAKTPPRRTRTPPQSQKPSPPQKRRGGRRRRREMGKKRGRRRRRIGGGGTPDPLVGTPAQVPYGGGVEVGTVTGVHTRKSGVVWVRYPNNPKLYEVERHLIFGTAEAAEAHLQKVRKGKTTSNPRPQQSRLTPRLTPKKTLNPTQIPPLTHLTPHAKPKVPRHYVTRKRAPGRFNTATMAGMAKHMSRKGYRVCSMCFCACVGGFYFWKVCLNFVGLHFNPGDTKHLKFTNYKPKINVKFYSREPF